MVGAGVVVLVGAGVVVGAVVVGPGAVVVGAVVVGIAVIGDIISILGGIGGVFRVYYTKLEGDYLVKGYEVWGDGPLFPKTTKNQDIWVVFSLLGMGWAK